MLAVKTGAPLLPVALVNTGTFKKVRDKVIRLESHYWL